MSLSHRDECHRERLTQIGMVGWTGGDTASVDFMFRVRDSRRDQTRPTPFPEVPTHPVYRFLGLHILPDWLSVSGGRWVYEV